MGLFSAFEVLVSKIGKNPINFKFDRKFDNYQTGICSIKLVKDSLFYIIEKSESRALKCKVTGDVTFDLIKADSPYKVENEDDGDRNLKRMFLSGFVFIDLTFNLTMIDSIIEVEEIELEAEGFDTIFTDFITVP